MSSEIRDSFEYFVSFVRSQLTQFQIMREELITQINDLIDIFQKQKVGIFEQQQKYQQTQSSKNLIQICQKYKEAQEQQLSKFLNYIQQTKERLSTILTSDYYCWLDQQLDEEVMNVNLVLIDDSTNQQTDCLAIAFNQSGTIMASGSDNKIMMWNFNNGNIKEITTLSTGPMQIFSLIFSHRCNSFLSGSSDSIWMWHTQDDQSWQNVSVIQIGAYCMILNKNETKLYVGGQESITVLDINFEEQKLKKELNLPAKKPYCLSLNEEETFLAACSSDKCILVWEIQLQSIYQYQIIQTNQGSHNICFIKNTQFIWLPKEQYQQDCVYVYDLKDGEFQQQEDKIIHLQTDDNCYDCLFFPIVFNKGRKMFVVRHKTSLYLLQVCSNGKFKIVTQKQFSTDEIHGTMTKDGSKLVLWDDCNKKYQIYEIEIDYNY